MWTLVSCYEQKINKSCIVDVDGLVYMKEKAGGQNGRPVAVDKSG